jgi:hypothetical protein
MEDLNEELKEKLMEKELENYKKSLDQKIGELK